MEQLILVHRTNNVLFEMSDQYLVWKTCLRQILFCLDRSDLPTLLPGDQIFNESEAPAFLLEVICGLHSPVIGETEVQGQFRSFMAQHKKSETQIYKMIQCHLQKILSESKKIREKFLSSTGSHTYGSLVRKLLSNSNSVSLIGAGQFAQQIIPWLSEVSLLQLLVRNKSKGLSLINQFPNLKINSLNENFAKTECLIVCAPIANEELLEVLKSSQSPVKVLIDLRGLNNFSVSSHWVQQSYNLEQFMSLLKEQSHLRNHLKVKALKEINEWKNILALEMQIRPFGWEDLCG